MMISTFVQRLNVVLGSVVTLVVALGVVVNAFVAEIAPQLPSGWEDNTTRIGAAVVSVLGFAAVGIRRLTEVPDSQRGILPPD
jgi:hypothetical protein